MFNLGDYAFIPGDGVGQVVGIEEQDFGGEMKELYVVKIMDAIKPTTIKVPTDTVNGIRPLVSEGKVDEVYGLLKEHDIKIDNSTWNRRSREYKAKISTGSILEIAEVLRALFLLKTTKTLSFGEKKMLDQCKSILSEEISLTNGILKSEVQERIDNCFH